MNSEKNNIVELKLDALERIASLISSAVHLDTTLSAVLRVLHDSLQMERATLALLDQKKEKLIIRASYGLSVEEERLGIYGLDEGICGQVFSTAEPFIVPDVGSEPRFLNRTGARGNMDKNTISFIGVPIVLNESPVGVLTVDRLFDSGVSLREDVRFLKVVATLIGQFLSLNRVIARSRRKLALENSNLRAQLHDRYKKHYIIGQCKPMQEVFRTIERVASSKATVLLLGESGTGKELVAQAIHEAGPWHDKPFIKINCAALPENLLEAELFGHEKGAFTGADSSRVGRFELADKGTIFLDEIGEMPLSLQAKLLRVLQEQQFERLGSTRTIKVDVRIIAATNVDLEEAVKAGNFRNDLYYRLNVIPVHLPALRERKEDIPLLVEHFLRASNLRNNRNIRVSRGFLDAIMNYAWPGNVRELQNLLERLVVLAGDDLLREEDLSVEFLPSGDIDGKQVRVASGESEQNNMVGSRVKPDNKEKQPSNRPLEEVEKEEIRQALLRNGWVQARAARDLGITPRQIGYKIKKYKLKRPDFVS